MGNPGGISHYGKIYALTGGNFEVYDPNSNTWQELPSMDIRVVYPSLLSISDTKIWAIGGDDTRDWEAIKSIFEFDLVTQKWTQLPDMDIARGSFGAVVVRH